ncbi:methyltransferase domain-containing protein [Streptomyces pinistramenti]|uniref:methyltransferase domain-containing protein n=1 Tax=Streptomyces pinistramenti TaxID=2884812 RepID=UPI001D076D07|nr:methyltransferase domain-containing protein [Streptomyces pinistramenti]MCB5906289.1 methyltransferase domain-containing protein [Streptomyces pinistramenti]
MTSHEVAKLLREHHFAQRVEYARRRAAQSYEPWPSSGPAGPGHDSGASLWNLLHLGSLAPSSLDSALTGQLADLGLTDRHSGPGKWELTAFRGVLAARDRAERPGTGTVYIGEDSLRFVDTILDALPTGRALDVGCGSGITSCALARTCDDVTAVDLQEECLEATRLSGALNGVGERIRTWHGDFFRDFTADTPLNCICANLPYVPVPPDLGYSAAGNGGPDGLDLNRRLLRDARHLLDPDEGMLVMRFQSLGDSSGPMLLREIGEFAKATGHDVSVVADGRTVPEVRAALTALHAQRHNPALSPDAVLAVIDAHQSRFEQPSYFACSLVSRSGGTGRVTFTDLSGGVGMDAGLAAGRAPAGAAGTAEQLYRGRAADLPDGFWELGGPPDVAAPLTALPELVRAIGDAPRDGITGRALTETVFADRFAADATRARALYVTTELMLNCLADAGLARVQEAG